MHMQDTNDSYDGRAMAAGQGQTAVGPSPASETAIDGGSPSAALLGRFQSGNDGSASPVTTHDAGSPSADLVAAIASAGLSPSQRPVSEAVDGGAAPSR